MDPSHDAPCWHVAIAAELRDADGRPLQKDRPPSLDELTQTIESALSAEHLAAPLQVERSGSVQGLFRRADGIARATETVGGDSWKWAIQSKGLEQSACDTRVAKGYALAFVLNPRGPDHLTTQIMAEFGMSDEAKALIKQITGDESLAVPNTKEKRAEIVLWHENLYAMNDCLGICTFVSSASFVIGFPHMARLYALATGTDANEASLSEAGRRVVTLERMFNVREGYTREKDVLPYRMMHEPIAKGPMAGHVTSTSELQEMLNEYFELNGWDPATGIPGRESLERLHLQGVCA